MRHRKSFDQRITVSTVEKLNGINGVNADVKAPDPCATPAIAVVGTPDAARICRQRPAERQVLAEDRGIAAVCAATFTPAITL